MGEPFDTLGAFLTRFLREGGTSYSKPLLIVRHLRGVLILVVLVVPQHWGYGL
jgi:hypothetical protein